MRRLGVASALLFGSHARGDATKNSDIDIAVRPAPGVRIPPRKLLSLYGVLGAEFGYHTPIDVIVLPARNAALNAAIEKESIVAFS